MNCSKLKILKFALRDIYNANDLVNFLIVIVTLSLVLLMVFTIFLIRASGFHLPSVYDVQNSGNNDSEVAVLNNDTLRTSIITEHGLNSERTPSSNGLFVATEEDFAESERSTTTQIFHHPIAEIATAGGNENCESLHAKITETELYINSNTLHVPTKEIRINTPSTKLSDKLSENDKEFKFPFTLSTDIVSSIYKYKSTTPAYETTSMMSVLDKSTKIIPSYLEYASKTVLDKSYITESYQNSLTASEDLSAFQRKQETQKEHKLDEIKLGGDMYKELKTYYTQQEKHFDGTNFKTSFHPDNDNRKFYKELPYIMASHRIAENKISPKKIRFVSANYPQKYTKNSKRDLNSIHLNENVKYSVDANMKPIYPETDAEREERFNKALEKFNQVINLFGEMDLYFSTRLKNSIKKLAKLCEEDGPII